jgi:anti-sigma regulatory factor (Ser/Thr protein kinase)
MLLELIVTPETCHLRALRRLVEAWLGEDRDATRVHLVVTELVANAIEASPDDGSITVVLDEDDDSVRISVVDRGDGSLPAEVAMEQPPVESSRGRGLYIVSQLASLRIVRCDDATVVSAELEVP